MSLVFLWGGVLMAEWWVNLYIEAYSDHPDMLGKKGLKGRFPEKCGMRLLLCFRGQSDYWCI
jgi:hypothetical protein